MAKLRIKQRTFNFEDGKETIIDVNGCSVVSAVFNCESPNFGFQVRSFIADDKNKLVGKGGSWAEVRRLARQYAKDNFHRHAAYHNLSLN